MGVLTASGDIDVERMRLVRKASDPMLLTFHRAFDVVNLSSNSVESALQQVLDIGCDRLLTSGMADKAETGLSCLQRLALYSKARAPSFMIIAASGVNAQNCMRFITEAEVHGVHAGSSVTALVTPTISSKSVGDFDSRQVVSVQSVMELVRNVGRYN